MMIRSIASLALVLCLSACQSTPAVQPLAPVSRVDLQRFMGDWYVIGNIPTFIEREAFNAMETYRLADDGTIDTTFTFNKGALDGPRKQYTPRGFVAAGGTNAVWGMQFMWPIKAEYLIVHVDENYTRTIIARNKRDYVWIMARTPTLPEAEYAALVQQVRAMGYDVSRLMRVPHSNGAGK